MTTQHTQGEWKVARDGFENFSITDGGMKIIADLDHQGHLSKRENEANARLIAAAPKLLEALKNLIEEAKILYVAHEGEYGCIGREAIEKNKEYPSQIYAAESAVAEATQSCPKGWEQADTSNETAECGG